MRLDKGREGVWGVSYLSDLYGKGSLYHKAAEARTAPFVCGDKAPYVSPMSRTVVDGRTAHAEHMKQHGVMEAGDMKLGEVSSTENTPLDAPRQDIQRAIQELSSR